MIKAGDTVSVIKCPGYLRGYPVGVEAMVAIVNEAAGKACIKLLHANNISNVTWWIDLTCLEKKG